MVVFLFHLLHLHSGFNIQKSPMLCKDALQNKRGFQPFIVGTLLIFSSLLHNLWQLFHLLQKCCKTNSPIWSVSANPHKYWVFRHIVARSDYSHSSFTFVQMLIKCIISSVFVCFVIGYPHNPLRP